MKLGLLNVRAMIVALDESPLVERPMPGAAPTAFRIWASGKNDSDEGPNFFTEKSAQLLMAEQAARGRRMAIDINHYSLRGDVAAKEGRAAGWHSLEVRKDPQGNSELWAIDVEWCADIKAGLEAKPPEWRYFSPAFKADPTTAEVTSYVNLAVCINPLTHGLPSLASRAATITKDSNMDKKALQAALATMKSETATEDEKQAAHKAFAEYLDGLPEEKKDTKSEGDTSGETRERPAKDDKQLADKECAEGETPPAPPPKKDDDKGEEKREAKSAGMALASDVVTLNSRLNTLELEKELAERKDLSDSVRKWCMTQDVATVRGFLKAHPTPTAKRSERATQGDQEGAAAGLQGEEKEKMDKAMGVQKRAAKPYERTKDGELVIHNARPSDVRAHLAREQKGG